MLDDATIQNLRKEASRHREIALRIDKFIAEMQSLNGQTVLPLSTVPSDIRIAMPVETPPVGRFSAMTQGDAVDVLLQERGPMRAREIFDALASGGKPIAKLSYLSALLSRDARFTPVGNEKWDRSEKVRTQLDEL